MTDLRRREPTEYEKAGELIMTHQEAVIFFATIILCFAFSAWLVFSAYTSTNFPMGI